MKNVKALLFLLIILTNNLQAQQALKKIDGDYELTGDFSFVNGNATYFYREGPDFERIREGLFTYKCDMNSSQLSKATGKYLSSKTRIIIQINGKYKNGLKDGEWNSIFYVNFGEEELRTTKVNYKNGVPNGIWTCKAIDKDKKTTKEVTIKFNMGVMAGPFKFTDGTKKYEGVLDNQGFIDGKFSAQAGNIETVFNCFHGVQKLIIQRNQNTGELIKKYEPDSSLLKTLLNYQSADSSKKIKLNQEEIKVVPKTIILSGYTTPVPMYHNGSFMYINEEIYKIFDTALFFDSINGDKKSAKDWPAFMVYLPER